MEAINEIALAAEGGDLGGAIVLASIIITFGLIMNGALK